MKNKRIRQWLSILMAAALTLGSPVIPVNTAVTAQAAEAVVLTETDEREINFNKDWKFFLDESEKEDASASNYDDSSWEDVNLPHDFQITEEFSNNYEAESGFVPGGTGWYRKTVVFPASYAGKSVILNFDGVYNNAYVYVNGTKLGEHHYGYTNFSFDISDQITCDGKAENVIAVKAVNEFPSSRWYSGSGIYRDVTLTVANPVHVSLNGTYVTTPDLETQKDGDVTVKAVTTVQNDGSAQVNASVSTTIEDSEGKVVSKAAVENTLDVPAGNSADQEQDIIVNKPKLWDCDNPNLYYVKTEVKVGGNVVDTYVTEFGFRYIKYDANNGFYLNGTPVKMKGVCMHHDQGALGAIASEDAITRQVEILKEMGCNAIRTSHNAPSRNLLEICNRLGMLVMDESYDGWAYHKNGNSNDFGKYWNETLGADNKLIGGSVDMKYYQFCLESFINRDKNDPCNVMWSIGNEINFGVPSTTDTLYVQEYEEYTRNMIKWIQDIDNTRPITHGDNNVAGNANDLRTHVDALLAESGGVVGLNYSPGNYSSVHYRYSTWPLVGSETASAINSRGIYSTTGEYGNPGDYQNTAYDTHAVSWGQTARAAWLPVIQNDFMMGTFVWTGFDYIGEPTNWNGLNAGSVSGDEKAIPNSSYFGIIDTAGFPKDAFYFYSSQWKEDKTTLHIVPGCWNEEALTMSNGKAKVDIYSNAAKVELLLNGEVIGTATRESLKTNLEYEYGMYRTVANDPDRCTANNTSANTANNMAAQFSVKYEAGTLSAKAYDENGTEITDTFGTKTVKTNSDAGSILKVTPEKTEIQADGSSLAYIDVDILDKNGEFASQARNNIRFTLTGNGEIAGVDNGNASTVDKFQQKSVLTSPTTANIDAFSGKALVIVRSTEKAGGFTLRVESNGMETQIVEVNTVGENKGTPFLKDYELQTEYTIDMGTEPVFQSTATCIMSDDTEMTATLTWDAVSKDIYNTPGDYRINGVLTCGTEQISVVAVLHVNPIIIAVKNVSKATMQGVIPVIPETVSGILPDGRLYGDYPVTWDEISDKDLSNVGDLVTVSGSAAISDTVTLPVTLTIRVADTITDESQNVAPACSDLTETSLPASDNLRAIIDGDTNLSTAQDNKTKRWTNWDSALTSGTSVTFKWNKIQNISSINLYYYTDSSIDLPDAVSFSYFDGLTSKDLKESDITVYSKDAINTNDNNKATYELTTPINAASLTISITGHRKTSGAPPYTGLIECEIFNTGITYQQNNSAALKTLELNNEAIPNFSPDVTDYTVEIDGRSANAVVKAASDQNPSITVLPIDEEKNIRIIVESEDGSATKTYTIHVQSENDDIIDGMKPDVDEALNKAEEKAKDELKYTADSWANFQNALAALKTAWATGSPDEITNAIKTLNAAMANLKNKLDLPPAGGNSDKPLPLGNYTSDDKTADYQVVASTVAGGTVTFVKPAKKTNKKFIVPDTVIIQGRTYTVTKIANNAFKNNKKLTNVTIGKNITEIGKSAFDGDKKLKTIKINSTVLTKVGKKAFKGISNKAKIKVPKSKKKQYKKLLKGKGQKSSVKIS